MQLMQSSGYLLIIFVYQTVNTTIKDIYFKWLKQAHAAEFCFFNMKNFQVKASDDIDDITITVEMLNSWVSNKSQILDRSHRYIMFFMRRYLDLFIYFIFDTSLK